MHTERVTDAALVVAGLALTVLAVKGHWAPMPAPVIAIAGTLGALAQYPRRRRPALAAIAGAVSYALSGNPLPLLTGVYSAGAHGPRRRAWALAAVAWAGFAAWSLLDAGRLRWPDAAAEALAVALVTGVGVYVSTRRELADSWRERAERADAERRLRDERARADERTRIAREMHDVLAHKVSLIALHAGALELVAAGDERVREGAGLIRSTAREALQELRDVLGVLQEGAPASDLPDLPTLIDAATRAGQRVELHDEAGELPPTAARVAFRVVQEGLTNAAKHAPGAPVTVSMTGGPTVVVDVRNASPDGGPALDLPGAGAGLVGLTERLRLVGGTVSAGPTQDGGWCLTAVIPRPEEAA
ncbi:MAG TPA: histidine kinase [Dactylosporangium sp.]|nr:histidine kinase [Dactylosporangium sp.]